MDYSRTNRLKQIEITTFVLLAIIFIIGLILGWPIEMIVGIAILTVILAIAYTVSPVLATVIVILYLVGSIVAWNRISRYRTTFKNVTTGIMDEIRQRTAPTDQHGAAFKNVSGNIVDKIRQQTLPVD